MELWRIDAGYFWAGVETNGSKVTNVAPIISYMRSWTLPKVQRYCEARHWELKRVEPRKRHAA